MVLDIINKRIEFILDGEWVEIDNFDEIAQNVYDVLNDWAFKLANRYWTVYTKYRDLNHISPYRFLFDETIITINLLYEVEDWQNTTIQEFLKIILNSIKETKIKLINKIGYYITTNQNCVQNYNADNKIQFKSDLRRNRINDALLNKNSSILQWSIEIEPYDNSDAKLEFEHKQCFNKVADIWDIK